MAAVQRRRFYIFHLFLRGGGFAGVTNPSQSVTRPQKGDFVPPILGVFISFLHISIRERRPSSFTLWSSFIRVLQCDVANFARNLLKVPVPRKALKMKVHFPCTTKKGGKIAQAGLEEQSVIIVAHI